MDVVEKSLEEQIKELRARIKELEKAQKVKQPRAPRNRTRQTVKFLTPEVLEAQRLRQIEEYQARIRKEMTSPVNHLSSTEVVDANLGWLAAV